MQTNYKTSMHPGLPGMLADSGNHDIVGQWAANEDIAFGFGVARDGEDQKLKVIDTDTDVFQGIALRVHNEDGKYKQYDPVNVMRKGRIWVPVLVTVAVDEAAYIDVATGTLTNISAGNVATNGFFRRAHTYNASNEYNVSILSINLP